MDIQCHPSVVESMRANITSVLEFYQQRYQDGTTSVVSNPRVGQLPEGEQVTVRSPSLLMTFPPETEITPDWFTTGIEVFSRKLCEQYGLRPACTVDANGGMKIAKLGFVNNDAQPA